MENAAEEDIDTGDTLVTLGFAIRVMDPETRQQVMTAEAHKMLVQVERPDGSVIQREAFTMPDHPDHRVEVDWEEEDLTLSGVYTGETMIQWRDGEEYKRYSPSFKFEVCL